MSPILGSVPLLYLRLDSTHSSLRQSPAPIGSSWDSRHVVWVMPGLNNESCLKLLSLHGLISINAMSSREKISIANLLRCLLAILRHRPHFENSNGAMYRNKIWQYRSVNCSFLRFTCLFTFAERQVRSMALDILFNMKKGSNLSRHCNIDIVSSLVKISKLISWNERVRMLNSQLCGRYLNHIQLMLICPYILKHVDWLISMR